MSVDLNLMTRLWNGHVVTTMDAMSSCFAHMVNEYADSSRYLSNHEERIRDVFVNDYLNQPFYREKFNLGDYLFASENPDDLLYNGERGIVDIKITKRPETFIDPKTYYILVECKRLDGSMKLSRAYVDKGILRFCEGKYTSPLSVNGMLGFMVSLCKPETIRKDLNNRLKKLDRVDEKIVSQSESLECFKWKSVHKTASGRALELHHRMLACSRAIKAAEG